MKVTKFLTLALCGATFFASCSSDNEPIADEVVVPITVSAPEAISRAVGGTNSAVGGLGNVDMTKFDLRYIIEVYNEAGTKLAVDRIVKTFDTYESLSQDVRLTAGRKYKFVAWVDFVAQGSTADLHYNTAAGLDKITFNTNAINDESRDAYTGVVTDLPTALTIEAKRPFGKLRVVTDDAAKLSFSEKVAKVTVTYSTGSRIPAGYNAVTQMTSTTDVTPTALSADLATYTADTDVAKTLMVDYIFAGTTTQYVKFNITALTDGGTEIYTRSVNADVPVAANTLTSVKGSVLTANATVSVSVSDSFTSTEDKTVE